MALRTLLLLSSDVKGTCILFELLDPTLSYSTAYNIDWVKEFENDETTYAVIAIALLVILER